MPWNTLIPSGNIYSKPKELGSKEKKMFLLEAHLMNTQTLQKKNLPSQDGDNGKEVPLTCSQAREGHIRAKITLWHLVLHREISTTTNSLLCRLEGASIRNAVPSFCAAAFQTDTSPYLLSYWKNKKCKAVTLPPGLVLTLGCSLSHRDSFHNIPTSSASQLGWDSSPWITYSMGICVWTTHLRLLYSQGETQGTVSSAGTHLISSKGRWPKWLGEFSSWRSIKQSRHLAQRKEAMLVTCKDENHSV